LIILFFSILAFASAEGYEEEEEAFVNESHEKSAFEATSTIHMAVWRVEAIICETRETWYKLADDQQVPTQISFQKELQQHQAKKLNKQWIEKVLPHYYLQTDANSEEIIMGDEGAHRKRSFGDVRDDQSACQDDRSQRSVHSNISLLMQDNPRGVWMREGIEASLDFTNGVEDTTLIFSCSQESCQHYAKT